MGFGYKRRQISLMLWGAVLMTAASLCLAMPAQTQSSSTTAHHTTHKKKSTSRKKSHGKTTSKRGQQKIDGQRAEQIQQALIREHYLTGTPSGVWDSATQSAMQKFQADNGWQSKTTPDSRALIKLGLGPDQQHLLNPESAMTSQPVSNATPGAPGPGSNSQPRK